MTIAIPLSPRLLIAATSTFVGMLEAAKRGGPARWAESLVRELGVAPGNRWDVPLLQHCGYWSHFNHHEDHSSWPVPAALIPDDFAVFGHAQGLLRDYPEEGDILLQFNPRRHRFVRAGLVVRVVGRGWWSPKRPYVDVLSVEGGTGEAGELGGADVLRVARRMAAWRGDRFLRWADATSASAGPRLGAAA